MKGSLFPVIILSVLFYSCDPASGIYVTNKLTDTILIEYEFNDIKISEYHHVNNNIILTPGEQKPIVGLFPGTSIIETLGFDRVTSSDDIINAIDQIFKFVNIYKYINNEKQEIIYDKNYFLNLDNMKWRKHPISYSIEYVIK